MRPAGTRKHFTSSFIHQSPGAAEKQLQEVDILENEGDQQKQFSPPNAMIPMTPAPDIQQNSNKILPSTRMISNTRLSTDDKILPVPPPQDFDYHDTETTDESASSSSDNESGKVVYGRRKRKVTNRRVVNVMQNREPLPSSQTASVISSTGSRKSGRSGNSTSSSGQYTQRPGTPSKNPKTKGRQRFTVVSNSERSPSAATGSLSYRTNNTRNSRQMDYYQQNNSNPSLNRYDSNPEYEDEINPADPFAPTYMANITKPLSPKASRIQQKLAKFSARERTWPIFLILASIVQIIMMCVELGMSAQWTGSAIETEPFNYMIGPGSGTLIRLGARFVPCMKSPTVLTGKTTPCNKGFSPTGLCTVNDICGIPPDATPNQWWRFISPIFLHGGVLHLLMNLFYQYQIGFRLESQIHSWRMFIIYMGSGVFGFVFGGNFAPPLAASVGASGAIMGLIGCTILDIILNWKIYVNPLRNLLILLAEVVFLVIIGMVVMPGVDNFAHIGGLIMGALLGLVLMPTINFSKWEKTWKWVGRIGALVAALLLLIGLLISFYQNNADQACSWCKYLSCIPTSWNRCEIQ